MTTLSEQSISTSFLLDEEGNIFKNIKLGSRPSDNELSAFKYKDKRGQLSYNYSTNISEGIYIKIYVTVENEIITKLEFFLEYNLKCYEFSSNIFEEVLLEIYNILENNFGKSMSEKLKKKSIQVYPEGKVPEEKELLWELENSRIWIANYWSQDPEDRYYDHNEIKIVYRKL